VAKAPRDPAGFSALFRRITHLRMAITQRDSYLLILEDNDIVSGHLRRWLKANYPEQKVVVARTIAEAQLFISELPVDFFILDIMLPDGNGIDFLCDLRMVQSTARVIIQTATPLPEYRERASGLGIIRFMEKPIDLKELDREIQLHKNRTDEAVKSVTGSEPSSAAGVQAVLESLSLLDIVQLKCLSRCSSALEFTRPDGDTGRIFFKNGTIVHAEVSGKEGEAAFGTILSWHQGRVRELRTPGMSPPETIQKCWQMLLLEASQAIDEGRVGI
jgi:DNA-binding response OmpR family regulator